MAELSARPDHVPAERVIDFDFFHMPGSDQDVHRAWATLQSAPAICWTPHNGGHWIATRAGVIEAVQRDWELFSNTVSNIPRNSTPSLPLETDPPQHTGLRALISPLFAPETLKSVETRARAACRRLIDGFADQGGCDFASGFARRLPIEMFLHLVDLPLEDAPFLLNIAEIRVVSSDPDARNEAKARLVDYLEAIIRERKANPRQDFISRILAGKVDGRELNAFEAENMLSTLMVGGLHTVAAMLGFSMRFLALSARHRKQLVDDPALIPKAVNELIRRHGVSSTARKIQADTVYEGVQFRAGDLILIPNLLVGLDDTVFANPFDVDFNRPNASAHAAFGNGPHRCPGANLARLELKVALEEWLARIPEFTIPADADVQMFPGIVNSVTKLPLAWDVSCVRPRADALAAN